MISGIDHSLGLLLIGGCRDEKPRLLPCVGPGLAKRWRSPTYALSADAVDYHRQTDFLSSQWGHPFEHELFDAARAAVIGQESDRQQTVLTGSAEKVTVKARRSEDDVAAYRFTFTWKTRRLHLCRYCRLLMEHENTSCKIGESSTACQTQKNGTLSPVGSS